MRLGGQLSQHAFPLGKVPHPGGELVVHADMDEGGQRPVRSQDAEGPVAGIDQLGRGLDDAPQGHVQVQPRGDTEKRVEQALHSFLGAGDGVQPFLDLVEEFGQAHPRQRRPPAGWPAVFRECSLTTAPALASLMTVAGDPPPGKRVPDR